METKQDPYPWIPNHSRLLYRDDNDDILLFHVSSPENIEKIMEGGFINKRSKKGVPGIGITYEHEKAGVWLANVPPITLCSIDSYAFREDDAWVSVTISEADIEKHGEHWLDESWPTYQWLFEAEFLNKMPIQQIGFEKVLAYRGRKVVEYCVEEMENLGFSAENEFLQTARRVRNRLIAMESAMSD